MQSRMVMIMMMQAVSKCICFPFLHVSQQAPNPRRAISWRRSCAAVSRLPARAGQTAAIEACGGQRQCCGPPLSQPPTCPQAHAHVFAAVSPAAALLACRRCHATRVLLSRRAAASAGAAARLLCARPPPSVPASLACSLAALMPASLQAAEARGASKASPWWGRGRGRRGRCHPRGRRCHPRWT